MTENKNKPAFPSRSIHLGSGLTKREYFAAMILQGMCAYEHVNGPSGGGVLVQVAVRTADQLIKALES